MTRNFEKLIMGVCAILDVDEPQHPINGEPIFLDDVMFSFVHEPYTDPDRVILFSSFGDLPRKNQIKILESLLNQNYVSFSGEGPGFSISPTTGKVVFSLHVSLNKTSPVEVANRMQCLARKAREWRKAFFMGIPSTVSLSSNGALPAA